MFVLMCIVFSEGFASSMILPFIAFMVIDFGIPEESVGYYAGYITSSFFLAQFVSSFFWGYISDVKGRRVVLLFSLLGNTFCALGFGFSKMLWWAILARSSAGLLNGSVGVVKSYIREITDETNQSKGYIMRSAGYAIGGTLGPFVGGVLAQPATQFPEYFSSSGLFGRFPYLLPCLVSSTINLIGFITGYFYLRETNTGVIDNSESKSGIFSSLLKLVKSMDSVVMTTIALYGSISFIWIGFDEVFGIWALRPFREGGINFDTFQIGITHAFSSVCMLLLQLFLYVPLERKFGSRGVFILGMVTWAPVLSAVPITNLIENKIVLWIVLLVGMGAKSAIATGSMASINILINNTASSKVVGIVNGLSTSAAALAKLLGPTVGGSVFAWSAGAGLPFPLDFHLIFLVLTTMCAVNLGVALWLPKSVDLRKL